MPGPKTHDIFYKNLKQYLSCSTLESFPHYDEYNLFAQGHDFFIYHNFYKIWSLNNNIKDSVMMQETKFSEFVYNYLRYTVDGGFEDDEQVRLFIGPGYVMHHILDAYTHPQIIYYAGDHARNPNNATWQHGIVENLIDIYMMEKFEAKDPNTYPVYQDFSLPQSISPKLIQTLNHALFETYHIRDGGDVFAEAFSQMELFMKMFKYDPTGIKQKIFDAIDPVTKGTSSFSYHRDSQDALQWLDLEHQPWLNPTDASVSTASFLDLFNKALHDGATIVDRLEDIFMRGIVNPEDIFNTVPNISSVHGLDCKKPFQLKYTRNKL